MTSRETKLGQVTLRLTVGRAVEPRLVKMTARCSASQLWRALAGESAGLSDV